jgi:thioredoxin 1
MGNVLEAVDSDFDELVLRHQGPVLVDFWAAWCNPCRLLAPIFEGLAGELAGRARIVKVDVEAAPALRERFGIRGLPTVVVFAQGVEKARLTGVQPKDRYVKILNALAADSSGNSPELDRAALMDAITFDNLESVRGLLTRCPGIADSTDELEPGPVGHARKYGRHAVLELLLAADPRLNHVDLAALGRADELRTYLAAMPEFGALRAKSGGTALQLAALGGHAACVRLLLDAGASPDEMTPDVPAPPAVLALKDDRLEILRLLLDAGIRPDSTVGTAGETLLHLAAKANQPRVCELLLARGADPEARGGEGKSAEQLAEESGHSEVLAAFRRA